MPTRFARIVITLPFVMGDVPFIVEFDAPRTHTVMVSGDVKSPGRVSMLEDVRTVADAINKAFGSFAQFKEKFTSTAVTMATMMRAGPVRTRGGSLKAMRYAIPTMVPGRE